MTPPRSDHSFRFRYVAAGGGASLLRKKGGLDDRGLVLGDDLVPFEAIVDTTVRDKRLIMQLDPGVPLEGKPAAHLLEGAVLGLEVSGMGARELERVVDRECAAREMVWRREELEARGESHLFRSQTCPACHAEVDLSGVEESRYVFCRFCDTVFSGQGVASHGERYTICDECGMFGRIKSYPEFYFYFLLIVYGFSHRKRFLCETCAGRLFWKALLRNLIFVIGVPTAIWVKVKSLVGKDPGMRALAEANRLAAKGRYQEASMLYDEVRRGLPDHPGLLLNQALGHLHGGDPRGATRHIQKSLSACPNYLPTLRVLAAASAMEAADAPDAAIGSTA